MRFSEFHQQQDVVISFELFPPKTPEAEQKLFGTAIPNMLQLSPAFLTCTYGAGGSTRDKTLRVVDQINKEFNIEAASHLTCVGASRREVTEYLEDASSCGVSNIVALRGDPPQGDDSFKPHPDGFKLGIELVEHIKKIGGFDIAVAGYPEGHPESNDKHEDWRHCAAKVDAGADVVITQLFYNVEDYFEYEDYLKNQLGVKVPIVPGVLPILNKAQIEKFCGMCGAVLPTAVQRKLAEFADDNEACRRYGVELATQMCDELIRHGVAGIHFYTLNRSKSTAEVMQNLGLVAA